MLFTRIQWALAAAALVCAPALAQGEGGGRRAGARAGAPLEVTPSPSGELRLRYDRDVGYAPAASDALAVGPDSLCAGPAGFAAVHDLVRGQVVSVRQGQGVVGRFDVSQVDGLACSGAGEVVVMHGGRGELTVHEPSGALVATHKLGQRGRPGVSYVLEDGVVSAIHADGSRQEVALLVGGRPAPIGGSREALRLSSQGDTLTVGAETVSAPGALRVSGQVLGGRPPWVEIEAVRASDDGRVQVQRWAQRVGLDGRVPLPVVEEGYRPSFDLAVDPGGTLVFLDPDAEGVTITWVEAS